METTELLKKVRKIEIKTRGISNRLFAGEYHSVFKGKGMSFSEVREYQYGDDVRSIDWNVTARFNHPYIKIFEEERELTVMLLVDVSRSSYFGTRAQLKREMMVEICAVIAFSAINNNDKVGVIFFSDMVEKYIPPKKGRNHILRIIRELINFEPTGRQTKISEALVYFNNVIKKRSIAFVLSDYMAGEYREALTVIARKHDVIGLRIYDQLDKDLPKAGLLRAIDAETGQMCWIDTSRKKVRAHYRKHYEQHFAEFSGAFLRSGADQISIQTGESYINALIRFFRKREMRK